MATETAQRGRMAGVALLVSVAAVAAVAASAPAAADVQRATGILKRASIAVQKRDWPIAVHALEEALDVARSNAPLEARALVVVREPSPGMGLYTPAPNDVVIGRLLRLYVETAGFGSEPLAVSGSGGTASGGTASAGLERVRLTVSGTFSYDDSDDAGRTVQTALGEKPLGAQMFETRTHLSATSFGLEVKLGERSPGGVYHVRLRIHDDVTDREAFRETRFVLDDELHVR